MKKAAFASATVASVLSLVMAVSAAQADSPLSNARNQGQLEHPGVATTVKAGDSQNTREIKDGITRADNAMRNTADRANAGMRNAADDVRAFFAGSNDPNAPLEPVVIRRDSTAEAMLGKDVVDANGKKIASVHDIILGNNGRPAQAVLSEGGIMGVGAKKVAVDYSNLSVTTNDRGNSVISGLSPEALRSAPEFSYDKRNATSDGREGRSTTAAASVKEILDGKIVDAKGDNVAAIENISFSGGNTQLIVKFNDTFGMGGNLAAMNLSSLERVDNDGEVNYRLSDAQSTKFRNYKAAVE